jgi:hypothetical protein
MIHKNVGIADRDADSKANLSTAVTEQCYNECVGHVVRTVRLSHHLHE